MNQQPDILTLETERLKFRQWQESDFDAVAAYFAHEENVKYVGGRKNPEAAWRLIATYIGHYHLKGYSYPAIEEKTTGKLIGTVGLWNSNPWPELELGYWLFNEFQGKGYAAEAGKAVKSFALEDLKAKTLVSYIDPANKASIKAAEKIGGFFDGTCQLLEFGLHHIYRYNA